MGIPLRTNKQKEVERIIDSLSRAIAQHLLPPGTRLVEAQIVDSLNANRNHVQAALQRLALQKIVTIEPNRGAHVSQPTAREVFVARRAIEGAVVASITPQGVHHFEAQVNAHMAAEGKATRNSDRRAILQALTAGDNEQAMELMKHHLDHLEAELALGKDQDHEVDLKAVLTSV